MTGLHVAEPQPLWLSLQHTQAYHEIAGAHAEVADTLAQVVGVPVEVDGAHVGKIADSTDPLH